MRTMCAGAATKPELLQMIKRAAAARMPSGWVAADEAYGDNRPLRDYLKEEEIAYVPRSWPSTSATPRARPRTADP